VLYRLRHRAGRWPRLIALLAVLSCSSQSLAATLDWCLHGDDHPHVTNALAPCATAAPVHFATAGADEPRALGYPAGDAHHGAHVAAASDAVPGAGAATPAAARVALHRNHAGAERALACRTLARTRQRPAAPPDSKPRMAGAVAGQSVRLRV
jgi:hypothetical protein